VPVGNDGETLVADSSTTTGLRYNPTSAAGKNFLINGGMDIWQRGTSFPSFSAESSTTFAADRWQVYIGNTGRTVSQQASGLTAFRYSMRVARDSGNTSTAVTQISQNIESNMSYPLAGKTVTVSFYGKAGANYSAASGALTYALYQGTGIDQNIFSMTGGSGVGTGTATLTTSWQRFSFTVAVPSTSTELAVYFLMTPVGTAGANDWFEITGVQLELGSTATTFSRAGGTIQGELAACQRYYYRTGGDGNDPYGVGAFSTTTVNNGVVQFPVTMRTRPTALEQSGTATDYRILFNNGATNCSAVPVFQQASFINSRINFTIASGGTAGGGGVLMSNSANSYLGWSAEL
jgi:hypothetical protein